MAVDAWPLVGCELLRTAGRIRLCGADMRLALANRLCGNEVWPIAASAEQGFWQSNLRRLPAPTVYSARGAIEQSASQSKKAGNRSNGAIRSLLRLCPIGNRADF